MPLPCGETPDASGYGYCGDCVAALRKKIWSEMSYKEKAYDRHFDPKGSAALDRQEVEDMGGEYDTCCSCHINPPCNYCIRKSEEENE